MNIFDAQVPQVPTPQAIPVVHESLAIISERMGKITQALVLIATVAPDRYSLLAQTVDYMMTTLSHVHELEYAPEYAPVADVYRVTTGIRHIIHHWELCHTAGLISDMNYQVVSQEIKNLEQFVREKLITYCIGQVTYPFRIPDHATGGYHPEQISLESYFSGIALPDKKSPTVPNPAPVTEKEISETPVKNIKDKDISSKIPPKELFKEIAQSAQKVVSEYHVPVRPQHKPELTDRLGEPKIVAVSGEDKKERRDAIMRTIRSKGQVTIKDISENIKGISEKTIQRDLQELIQHGVLIREGEKRWAVYKLAMKNV